MHGIGAVRMPQARPVAKSTYRADPVQGHAPLLVAPPRLRGEGSPAEILDPPGESEGVEEQGAGVPSSEDEASSGFGAAPDALAGLHEPRGGARWIYAPPATSLLLVRGMTGVVGHGLVCLLEARLLEQLLHAEGVGGVAVQEQLYLVEVVLGPVGGVGSGHAGLQKLICVLAQQRIHEAEFSKGRGRRSPSRARTPAGLHGGRRWCPSRRRGSPCGRGWLPARHLRPTLPG